MWWNSLISFYRGRQSFPWTVSTKTGPSTYKHSVKWEAWSKLHQTAFQTQWRRRVSPFWSSQTVRFFLTVVLTNFKLKSTWMEVASSHSNLYRTWIWSPFAPVSAKCSTQKEWSATSQSIWFLSPTQLPLRLTPYSGRLTSTATWLITQRHVLSSTSWWRERLTLSLASTRLIIHLRRLMSAVRTHPVTDHFWMTRSLETSSHPRFCSNLRARRAAK